MGILESSLSNSGGNWFGKFLVFVFILGFIILSAFVLFSVCQHALDKHGNGALLVDNCLSAKGNHLGVWQRKSDGHLAFPCEVEKGKWGIKFDKCTGENCTSLIKEKFFKICQIIRYLNNTGYEPVDTIAKGLWELYVVPAQAMCEW